MAVAPAASTGGDFTTEQQRILTKVLWRIVPFLLLCYIVAYLDRVNVGVASLKMNHDLAISPAEFGWSAGLFFFGYFLAEVPSNLALQALGARTFHVRTARRGPGSTRSQSVIVVRVRLRQSARPARARSRLKAALISARCVNACGKLPRASPLGPVCSAYSPRWLP